MNARQEMIDGKVAEALARLDSGESVYLYKSLYLPVDSTVRGDGLNLGLPRSFDLGILPQHGLEGWEVVASIPVTLGLALTNMSLGSAVGNTWGAGLGGNVVGTHVIMRREIRGGDAGAEALLRTYVSEHFAATLTSSEEQRYASLRSVEAENMEAARRAHEEQAAEQRRADREAVARDEMALVASDVEQYGITFDGEKYCYRGYRYERLEDALNYARRDSSSG